MARVKMMNNEPSENMETLFDQDRMTGDGSGKEKGAGKPKNEAAGASEPGEIQPQPEPEAGPEHKENAGEILKREREAQGLSLDIVHEATKIPMDALRAIEEGYKVRMLSPFYYKGFLKMYAAYLGVDVSQVVEGYHKEKLPQHIDPDVDGFDFSQWVANIFTKKRKQQIVVVAVVCLGLFLLLKIFGFIVGLMSRPSTKKVDTKTKIVKTQPVKKEPAKREETKTEARRRVVKAKREELRHAASKEPAPVVVKEVEPKVEVPPPPEPARRVPTVVPASIAQKDIALTVRAKQNSWLRVKADSNIVFQSTLRLGAIETWTADNEIEISGKNIDQLEFELNGKMIGTLGRKDRNAKKVVITKNGLSVKN